MGHGLSCRPGAGMVSIGLILTTSITQPWHLYLAFGLFVGGGSMFISYLGHSLFVPYWFARKRGLALGITFAGAGVGSIILFPWLQDTITRVGWRDACWIMALVLFVTVVPLNSILQRRRPEDLGLAPDGGAGADASQAAPGRADTIVDHAWAATDWTLALAVRTARFWWLALAMSTCLYAWYAVQVHQTKYLDDIGFSPQLAAYALGLVGLTGSAGQIGLGFLSDRIGREWVWTLSLSGFGLCYALLLVMHDQPSHVLLYSMVAGPGLVGLRRLGRIWSGGGRNFPKQALRHNLRNAECRRQPRSRSRAVADRPGVRSNRDLRSGVLAGDRAVRGVHHQHVDGRAQESPPRGRAGRALVLVRNESDFQV